MLRQGAIWLIWGGRAPGRGEPWRSAPSRSIGGGGLFLPALDADALPPARSTGGPASRSTPSDKGWPPLPWPGAHWINERERPVAGPPSHSWVVAEIRCLRAESTDLRRISRSMDGLAVVWRCGGEVRPELLARHRHRPGGRGGADQLSGIRGWHCKNTEQNLARCWAWRKLAPRRVHPCSLGPIAANGSSGAVLNEPRPRARLWGNGGRLPPRRCNAWHRCACGCMIVGPNCQTARK